MIIALWIHDGKRIATVRNIPEIQCFRPGVEMIYVGY